MKIQYLISLAMAAFLMTACSDEEEPASNATKGMLKATVEGSCSSTRAGFDDKGAFYWSMKDRLGVTTTENANKFSSLDLTSGGGTASATFDGTISGTIDGYAVYPYNDDHSMNGTTLTYSFPSTYTYTQVDGDYFTAIQGEGNSFNPAMWGKIASGSVQMKHLGGVFCIKIPKMPITQGILSLVSDKKIAGSFTVDLNGTDPVLTSTETSSTDNTVTITFSNVTVDQPGVFYVPVPVGSYDVRIKVAESQDATEKINVAAGVYAIARRDLKKIELNNGSIDATAPTESESLSDAESSLQNNDAVSVTEEISASSTNEISIPVTSGSEETSKSLSLEKVATGARLKVSDANTSNDAATSVDKFTLSIPNNESDDFKPLDVTIDMKYSTVTLTGNAGTATYGTVTATTAENTLVIGSDVTVEKVSVVKGNVRVNKGANLKAIEKNGSYEGTTPITIYVENGATYPTNLGEGFVVADATVADMKKVLVDGGTYTLSNDMEGDFVVSATAPVTIDLNGHKITNKAGDTFTVNCGSSLTIAGEGTVDNVTHAKACIYNNGTVILNGGTYTRSKENGQSDTNSGGNSYYNILNHGEMTINQSVSVSQNGKFSSMIASGYYDYSNTNPRNGYVNGTNAAAPKLTINGGTFSGGLNTIKNDDGATLEIKGGTFDNMSQATVQNHHVTTISGGTFNCSGATYAVDNEGHNNAEKDLGDMTITGGTFNGLMFNNGTGADMTVTGGTFSDPAALEYLPESGTANVKVKLTKDASSHGFVTHNQQTVEIDLGNHKYTLSDPTVGSAGTETNSCQLLEGSTVTFKNGTLESNNNAIMIQNYSTLTLSSMVVNGTSADYVVSNNVGTIVFDNTTINAGSGDKQFAFDVCGFSNYTNGVRVTVKGNSVINGKVEISKSANNTEEMKLNIESATLNGNLVVDESITDAASIITISDGVKFGDNVTGWDNYKSKGSAE